MKYADKGERIDDLKLILERVTEARFCLKLLCKVPSCERIDNPKPILERVTEVTLLLQSLSKPQFAEFCAERAGIVSANKVNASTTPSPPGIASLS